MTMALAPTTAVPSPSGGALKMAEDGNAAPGVAQGGDSLVPPALDCVLLTAPTETVNHLCSARLRLMSALPSVGIAWSLWCGQCGSLRDALSGTATPTCSKKRTSDGIVKEDDGTLHESLTDELERELERTLAAMHDGGDKEETAVPKHARKPQRRRKSPTCRTCGAKFRRPVPRPLPYISARSFARVRRASSLATCVKAEPEPERVLSPGGTVDAAELFEGSTPVPSEVPSAEAASPQSTALSRTPSLAHISSSDPATPTYPKPANTPPPQSGGTTVTVKLPTSPPPAKKRKTKKSGLAKLLAQNAQREQSKTGSGNWGLG